MEAHLDSDIFQGTRFEVPSSHPVFDGAEDMLDRSSPGSHCAGHAVEAGLHGLDDLFVFPSLDAPFDAGGAVCLYDATRAACRVRIGVQRHAVSTLEKRRVIISPAGQR